MSALQNARFSRPALLQGLGVVVGLLAFSMFFNLFVKLMVAVRPGQTFVYHWDAVGFMFLDTLLCLGIIVGLRHRLTGGYVRLAVSAGIVYVTTSFLLTCGVERFIFGTSQTAYGHLAFIVSQVAFFAMFGGLYIGYQYFRTLDRTRAELEQTRRARAQMELRLLQQAVDPHFLFNNLNILCALTEQDGPAAAKFARRLAKLYRYIVRHHQNDIVPLSDELAFVEDYVFLLEARFGAAFRCTFAADLARDGSAAVVPTAIQGLVENAIKHNQGTRDDPLVVTVVDDDDRVRVENRILKKADITSSGTGLNNLRARYAQLDDRPVEVQETAEVFSVSLPKLQLLTEAEEEAA